MLGSETALRRLYQLGLAERGPVSASEADAGEAGRLWIEDVPDVADGPLARRRLWAEMRRGIDVTGRWRTRLVLCRYTDGQADLVLATRRDATITEAGVSAPTWGLAGAEGARRHARPVVSVLDLSAVSGLVAKTAEPARLLATALSRTMARYADGGPTDVTKVATVVVNDLSPAPGLTQVAQFDSESLEMPLVLAIDVADGRVAHAELRYRTDQIAPAVAGQIAAGIAAECRPRPLVASAGPHPARRSPASSPECVHDAFAQMARAQPDAEALTCNGTVLRYQQLNDQADLLARGLVASGGRPGDRVAVCLQRSPDLVAILLAVLKAGMTYVPVDPLYPPQRIQFVAENAAVRLLLTEPGSIASAVGGELVILSPDELRSVSADLPASHPMPETTPDDLAYIIYTSGSTGRPKGVAIPHRNVLSLVRALASGLGIGSGDVWSLFHSCAFDFSVWEMWGCLLTGGRLVVVPYWTSRSPGEFHQLLAAEGVTVLSQTPSAFTQLIQADQGSRQADSYPRLSALRMVVLGGETLDARTLLPWFDRYPETGCRVVNMFGITETTVHVTAQEMTRAEAVLGSRSVGRPIDGWRVIVMNERGEPVPPGVAGEIYVGGSGVASHYVGLPGLTAQRFVPGPPGDGNGFPEPAGARLYRSGDRGRLLLDGRLEHLGRVDDQVKVRGFRIEPSEVRAVLLRHPAVRAAAVVTHGDGPDAQLDAYVVLAGGTSAGVQEVRRHAAQFVPDYMVPATMTVVTDLPLTLNGKIDRDRLPAPAVPVGRGGPVPETGCAKLIAEAWERLFGTSAGLDDNFFDLGGNSLTAIRLLDLMNTLGIPRVSIRTLYQYPTVRQLAAFVAGADRPEDSRKGT